MKLKSRGCLLLFVPLLIIVSTGLNLHSEPYVNSNSDEKHIHDRLEQALASACDRGVSKVDIRLDEKPGEIQPGDLVYMDYSLTLKDGRLLKTTKENVAVQYEKEGKFRASQDIAANETHYPECLIPGEGAFPEHVENSLLGMHPGDKKQLILPPESGGMPSDPENFKEFPRFRYIPRTMSMTVSDYKKKIHEDPVSGSVIATNPYVKHRVSSIEKGNVVLTADWTGNRELAEKMGITRITRNETHIVLELIPEVGAFFRSGSKKGRIVSLSDTHFTVDFNPPGSGEPLHMDIDVVALIKASQLSKSSINWIDDYQEGVKRMKASGKPMVLYLFKEDCPWCGKMNNEVLPNPMIQNMGDDFIWVRIDTGKHEDIKMMFGQDTFPSIILINPDENVHKAMEGYRLARILRMELDRWEGRFIKGTPVVVNDNDGKAGNVL